MRPHDYLIHAAFLFAAGGVLLLDLASMSGNTNSKSLAPAVLSSAVIPKQQPGKPAVPASKPVTIAIPSAGIASKVSTVGLGSDGAPSVPAGDDVDLAAWLDTSVMPGQKGASIIIGHVTTITSGPSVFYNLASLKPGQQISIVRQDGRIARFAVNEVQAYDKAKFPSWEVYGQVDYPALRLITCGGTWNDTTGQYSQNIVVFAALSDVINP